MHIRKCTNIFVHVRCIRELVFGIERVARYSDLIFLCHHRPSSCIFTFQTTCRHKGATNTSHHQLSVGCVTITKHRTICGAHTFCNASWACSQSMRDERKRVREWEHGAHRSGRGISFAYLLTRSVGSRNCEFARTCWEKSRGIWVGYQTFSDRAVFFI